MTFDGGYALGPQDALEVLDMGGGSVLSLKVTGQQSNGVVTVLSGVVLAGGPPLHVHEVEDEVVVCTEGELAYQVGEVRGSLQPGGLVWFPLAEVHAGQPFDPAAFSAVPGSATRTVVGPPLA